MAHEFDRYKKNGRIVWKCRQCLVEIVDSQKPRNHVCIDRQAPTPNPRDYGVHVSPLVFPTFIPNVPPPPFSRTSSPMTEAATVTPGVLRNNAEVLNAQQHVQPQSLPHNIRAGFSQGSDINLLQQQIHNQQMQHQQMIKLMNDQYQQQNEKRDQEMKAQQLQQQQLFQSQQLQQQQLLQYMQQQYQLQIEKREQDLELQKNMIENLKLSKNQPKKIKCPKWDKPENIEYYLERLKLWDRSVQHEMKYLEFTEALQEAGRLKEKAKVDLAVKNKTLNPEDPGVVANLIELFTKWYGTPEADKGTTAWRNFKHSKLKVGENINEFIQRYETYKSDLRASIGEVSNYLLAIQLLEAIEVNESQKQNILSSVNFTKANENVYEELKKSIKLLKGALTESSSDKEKSQPDEVTLYGEAKYGRGRSQFRGKQSRSSKSRSFERRFSSNDGSSDRSKRDHSSGRRSRDGSNGSRNRNHHRDNKQRYNNHKSYNNKGRHSERGEYQHEDVNFTYKEDLDNAERIFLALEETVNKMLLDCGASKTVCGIRWWNNLLEILDKTIKAKIGERPEKRYFRFGSQNK